MGSANLSCTSQVRRRSVGVGSGAVLKSMGLAKLSGLWETEGMKKPVCATGLHETNPNCTDLAAG
jgi:hypothetical protein